MPKGPVPHASDRPAGERDSGPSSDEFLGCLSGLSSNTASLGKSGEDSLCDAYWNYHYKVMSFGLKNAGSTYQKMMTRMFESQLGKNIKIYVDDMVVKSKVVSEHLGDLSGTFNVLRKHKLCLNASKCSFGMGSGMFLGYMVTHRGIKVNPDQIKAINDLKQLRNAKEV